MLSRSRQRRTSAHRRHAVFKSPLRRPLPRGDEKGSGAAIGMAILFPALMMLIVLLSAMSDSVRIEQSLQATANRVARTASLCCLDIQGANGALAVVDAGLEAAVDANTFNRIYCNNDLVEDAEVVFLNTAGLEVDPEANNPVPPAGTVYVFLRCEIPPKVLGGFGVPFFNAERLLVGSATIEPFRSRT